MTNLIDMLYSARVWQISAILCTLVVGATIAVQFLVDRLWNRELRRSHNDIAGFLIAVVGVIFAVLISSLAITVLTRQDRAEALVTQEADTLASIDRLGAKLAGSHPEPVHHEVLAYLDAVIDGEWPQMRRAEMPDAAAKPLETMWANLSKLPVDDLASLAIFQQLQFRFDHLTEARRSRGEIATTGVDRVVWGVMLMGSLATILFAVLFGVPNFCAHLLMTSLLSFTVALAIIMVVSIDWPYYGDDAIHPERLEALRAELIHRASPGVEAHAER